MASDLISRLESATEGSRELDEAICELVGWRRAGSRERGRKQWFNPAGQYVGMELAKFTTDINTALTLVPEDTNCHGYNLDPLGVFAHISRNFAKSGHWHSEGRHATSVPIAFCIAALKARGI